MIVVPLIIMSSKPITSPHTVTPESHVWEMYLSSSSGSTHILSLNKKTGEVRKYNSFYTVTEGSKSEKWFGTYRVTIPE